MHKSDNFTYQAETFYRGDEIDLITLCKIIFSKIIYIVLIASFLGGSSYFFVKTFIPLQYTATGVFAFDNGKQNPLGRLSDLASLAGFSTGNTGSKNIVPQALGRVFLEPFFRKHQLATLPDLQAKVAENDSKTVVFEKVFQDFRENHLFIVEDNDGLLSVSVILEDSEKAAHIVNRLMEDFILYKKDETARTSLDGLRYYSDELIRIQQDVDEVTTNVEEFALKANILSEDEFTSQSVQLESLRGRLADMVTYLKVLDDLKNSIDNGEPRAHFLQKAIGTNFGARLNVLPEGFFQVDWQTKLKPLLKQETDVTKKQKIALSNALKQAIKNTEATAKEAGEFRKLKQRAKVETITLEAFTEQFKKQQIISGFHNNPGQIFEYAVASIKPSKPRALLITAVTVVLSSILLSAGLFVMDIKEPKIWSDTDLRPFVPLKHIQAGARKTHTDSLLSKMLIANPKGLAGVNLLFLNDTKHQRSILQSFVSSISVLDIDIACVGFQPSTISGKCLKYIELKNENLLLDITTGKISKELKDILQSSEAIILIAPKGTDINTFAGLLPDVNKIIVGISLGKTLQSKVSALTNYSVSEKSFAIGI